ncbi:hypothetical protein F5876DRAFT_47740 [Lentinula aff. lateritia]|uniref:Uncharacterized protein n=1 Tax=Lentinula aff. lateritia TaxID=2804960 RepID=A0ACC1TS93_9AGAR|nr:hypothetical protein F5876DRAFT_47740 [Lentinula aff. lateritia]
MLYRNHTTPEEIINLLGHSESPSASVSELLKARSLANQRLRYTFNLTNTFVKAETDIHNTFVAQMKDLIRAQRRHGQWVEFLHIARQAFTCELNSYVPTEEGFSAAFTDFIQILTLRIIVVALLDPDRGMESIDAEDLRVSAMLITKLWGISKSRKISSAVPLMSDPCTSPDIDDLTTLNYHLRRLLPDTEKYPNPINFVIPTWETLWRVVATCLAHVHENVEFRRMFEELLEDPTSERFKTPSLDSKLCADWIVSETLRLHPPSRHISRSFVVEQPPFLQFVRSLLPRSVTHHLRLTPLIRSEIADVEGVHLSVGIWGADVLEFNPRRWARYTSSSEAPTLFAFGYGPLICIGKIWAPMAAALIVGAVLEGIEREELEIVGTGIIGGRAGWIGWQVQSREAFKA